MAMDQNLRHEVLDLIGVGTTGWEVRFQKLVDVLLGDIGTPRDLKFGRIVMLMSLNNVLCHNQR